MSQPTPEIRSNKDYHHKTLGRSRQADELTDSGVFSTVYSHTNRNYPDFFPQTFWHIDYREHTVPSDIMLEL